MNLTLTPEDERFREEVREFLKTSLPPELKEATRCQTGVFVDKRYSVAWHKILYQKGWAAPNWPREYGGTGWTETQRYVFGVECARAGAPALAPMGMRMVAPVIMRYGTQAQKDFYLPRLLAGEDYWCQGYSEPGSGSDLASLQLRAVSDGDDYVLDGSKIWTTHAHWANRMFCLVRTRTGGKPQAGISFLLLDMNTPGLTVRPIITLAGDHELNQVFFDNVRVPKANRVGEENEGWAVAKYLLEFERGGGSASANLKSSLAKLRHAASVQPADECSALIDDLTFRNKIAAAAIQIDAIEITELRVASELSAGKNPGPVSPMLKMQASKATQALDELAIEAAAYYGGVYQPEARNAGSNEEPIGPDELLRLMPRYLNNRAASIYGGSNEIQHDIIARLVLGL
jgi:acyl-CoA dehydrogenase